MIVSKERVKLLLQIQGEDKDELIEALIPMVEHHYQEIQNIPFERDEEDNPIYPDGSEIVAAMMVGFHLRAGMNATGYTSENIGDYSYSKQEEMIGGYPKSIVQGIRRHIGMK